MSVYGTYAEHTLPFWGIKKKKKYVLSQEVNEDKNGHALKYTSCMYRVQAWNHGENDFSRIKFNKNVIKPELQ